MCTWKHPELLTGEKLGQDSTIAAILDNEAGAAVVEPYGYCWALDRYKTPDSKSCFCRARRRDENDPLRRALFPVMLPYFRQEPR